MLTFYKEQAMRKLPRVRVFGEPPVQVQRPAPTIAQQEENLATLLEFSKKLQAAVADDDHAGILHWANAITQLQNRNL